MTEVSMPLSNCRACSRPLEETQLDLGKHALSGVFQASPNDFPPTAPLRLSRCSHCGLVQLADHIDMSLMYNDAYGYRSSINESMERHLEETADALYGHIEAKGAVTRTLDIGSNDGTLMNRLRSLGAHVFGCDPSIIPTDADLAERVVNDFFRAEDILASFGSARFNLITSIAMLYDLPDPRRFFDDIKKCLAPGGFWFFEQTDLRALVDTTAFDSICHEHTEYYSFAVLKTLAENHGMGVRRVWRTNANGSSLACICCHDGERTDLEDGSVEAYLEEESALIPRPEDFLAELNRAFRRAQDDIAGAISEEKRAGRNIVGLGASTKGNTLIQSLGLTSNDISFILDRAPFKHGLFTPGSNIPIFDEARVDLPQDATAIVFPWHFRDQFLVRYADFLRGGGKLLFPLPVVEII